MKSTKHFVEKFVCTVASMVALSLAVGVASAQTPYKVLADFNGPNGDAPAGSLVMDGSGNLYGVTSWGGNMPSSGNCIAPPYGCGVVYEVSPSSGGAKLTDIYKFSGPDGSTPGGGLVMDKSGNLYGVAALGGDGVCPGQNGCGLVYELVRGSNGSWTEKVLYQFQGSPDGQNPNGTLVLDKNGNLFGVTSLGGTGGGIAFELSPASGGGWTEKTIFTFTGGGQPSQPSYGMVMDGSGNLYGVTDGGDENGVCGSEGIGCGLVYELSPSSGEWTLNVIFSFDGTDGFRPTGSLIFDPAGNLYGTTADGGDLSGCNFGGGCGLVYELTPSGGSQWTEKVLHVFLPGNGGNSPFAGVTLDGAGNLYGTTLYGGASNQGVVFQLQRRTTGRWPEALLHSFTGGADGGQPQSKLLLNAAGVLFGTAEFGGITSDCTATSFAGCGVVFEVKK